MMKELYIAPEAQLLCFVAQQQLANINFDDLLAAGKKEETVIPEGSDVSIDIPV